MNILIFLFIFILGTLIGSFLNVVIYRFNSGKSIAKGRSICMSCNHTLRFYELVPIFSYLIQAGKCRRCSSRISHQYPIVEAFTGLVFAGVVFHFLPLLSLSLISYVVLVSVFFVLFSLLIVIAVYDMRHKIIPDTLSYAYAGITLASLFINYSFIGSVFVIPPLALLLAGPLLASPFALIWLISRGRWMGLGDAKLMIGIGWMLGLSQGIAALILAFWSGAIVSLIMMALHRRKITAKTEIPFAPFLILGVLIVFFCNLDIFSIISWFRLF
ncbi:MAG: prepilin peptidase [Candidatus Paceibacterota bacterium]